MNPDTIQNFIPHRSLLRSWQKVLRETAEAVLYNHKIPLRTPAVQISDSSKRLGFWDPFSRTIYISKYLLLGYSFDDVVETLKHELAHMIVDEHFKNKTESPHGKSFQAACRQLGISSAASLQDNGSTLDKLPGGKDTNAARMISKVKKLLALSGSMNIHEAEVAMQKANALITRYNLSPADAAENIEEEYTYRQIGSASARHPLHEILIANILMDFFFVEAIFVPFYSPRHDKHGTVLEILGRHENILVADYVYHFLMQQAEINWARYKEIHGIKGSKEKRSYLYGLLQGFRNKLEKQTRTESQDLVWVGHVPLQHFLKFRHPRIQKSGTSGSPIWQGAYKHGRRDGEKLTLHKPIHRQTNSLNPKRISHR